jgi:hypothetical protein
MKIDWHKVTVGFPRFWSMASWTSTMYTTLKPQSVITASHRLTIPHSSFGAPCMCVGLVLNNTSAGPVFFCDASPIPETSLSIRLPVVDDTDDLSFNVSNQHQRPVFCIHRGLGSSIFIVAMNYILLRKY